MMVRRCRVNLSTETNLRKKANRQAVVFSKQDGWFYRILSDNKTRKRRKDGYFEGGYSGGLTRRHKPCFSFFLVISSTIVANAIFGYRYFSSMHSFSRVSGVSLRRHSSPHSVVMANNTVRRSIAIMSPWSLSIPLDPLLPQHSELSTTERSESLSSNKTPKAQSMADRMQRNVYVSLPIDDGYVDDFYAPDGNPVVDIGTKQCRRNQWSRLLFSNCNTVHEYNAPQLFREGRTKIIGSGAFRTVFLTTHHGDVTTVLKTFNFDQKFDAWALDSMRVDALVAERLTSNPGIVDIFAHCGLAGIHEASLHGHIGNIAIPHGIGRIDNPLNDVHRLQPQNNILPRTKLRWSQQMADSVAALHTFPDGVMVHNDIQMTQFLFFEDGNLKLNDFNRAEILLFNEQDGEYCHYGDGPRFGDWRSPEEYADVPLNEKVDVWSLANNMYTLLTGLMPFYTLHNFSDIQKEILNGETGFIDPRWKERSTAERRLSDIIRLCWKFEPDERLDAVTLARLLRDAIEEETRVD